MLIFSTYPVLQKILLAKLKKLSGFKIFARNPYKEIYVIENGHKVDGNWICER